MPERDALDAVDEHPRSEAFVERVEVVLCQRLEQPKRHVWRGHRGGLEQRLSLWREARGAREHGLAYRRGHLGVAGGEGLRCEEGVAARPAIELVRVDSARLGKPSERVP